MAAFRWINDQIGGRRWLILFLGILEGGMAALNICLALQTKDIIDGAVAGDWSSFYRACLSMVGVTLLLYVVWMGDRFLSQELYLSLSRLLKRKAFGVILTEDYRKASACHSGEYMNRLTSDVDAVTDILVSVMPDLVFMAVRILGVAFVLCKIEPWLAAFFIVGGLILAGASVLPRRVLKRLSHRVQEEKGKVYSFLQESLESILTIQTFGCEKKMEQLADRQIKKHYRAQRKKNWIQNLCVLILDFTMEASYLLAFFWCGIQIMSGNMSYGTLTAVLRLVGQIQGPLADIGGMFPRFASAEASAERLMELSGGDQAEKAGKNPLLAEELYDRMKDIRFKKVSFGYEKEQPVLKNESFSIPKGEFTAIIGDSGIGKSTIMKLMMSIYQPVSGQIFLHTQDGDILASQIPKGLFAYVPQGNLLMSGPIWQVVGFADPVEKISMERVKEACKAACAQEFIEKLPKQYETELGEHGAGLSEGQMQRLAVARAVYSGYPILLLDEATSALDGETERRLMEKLRGLAGRTVVIVTHRTNTWEVCDHLLTFPSGEP